MKCETCGGSVIFNPGDCLNPQRLVCMSCGRELKGKEKTMEPEEMKSCIQCGIEFEPMTKKRRFCKKSCADKWYAIRKKKSVGNIKRKKAIRNPESPSPTLKIDDTILLDQQLIHSIKKNVANQIIKIIQEAFA